MERKKERLNRRDFLKATFLTGLSAFYASCRSEAPETADLEIPKATTTLPPEPSRTPFPPATPTPKPSPTPEPSPTPDTRSAVEKYIYPALADVTNERRNEKAFRDPEYLNRLDREVNQNRINFILLGRRGRLTDSIHLLPLDLRKNELDAVTMHRDFQAPEVSRFVGTADPYRINQAYLFGGIPLAEKTLEDATGLSTDFMMVMEMRVLERTVKGLFDNKLEVELPWPVPAGKYYYPQGKQILSGEDVLRVSRERYYGSNWNRNIVQQQVLKAIFSQSKKELTQGPVSAAEFMIKSFDFLSDEVSTGAVETSFGLEIVRDLSERLIGIVRTEGLDLEANLGMPSFGESCHIKSEENSKGRYLLKPLSADPDVEDLINGYWYSSRSEVKDFLLSN